MKLFEEILKCIAIIGLYKFDSNNQNKFNYRNVGVLIFYALCFISCLAFVIYDAHTPREYAESFFTLFLLLFVGIGFFYNILKASDLFALQTKVEDDVDFFSAEHPELLNLFVERNKTINKLTKLVHTLFIKVTIPSICIPPFFVSFYLYFEMDWGSDAFILYDFMKWDWIYKMTKNVIFYNFIWFLFPKRFPFNRKTPIGYVFAALIESCAFIVICQTVFCALSLVMGFYGITMLCTECAEKKFRDYNQNRIKEQNKNDKMELRSLLHYHSLLKQLSILINMCINKHINCVERWAISYKREVLKVC